jgi:sugar O-acyltransferase (sialic acid O-acetyltransferase NeuD family)
MISPQRGSSRVCIFGTGGFGRETLTCFIDYCNQIGVSYAGNAIFIIDDAYFKEPEIMGIKVIPFSKFNVADGYEVVIGVGDPGQRKAIAAKFPSGTKFGKVIHPSAVISEWVQIGGGSIITAGCVLTCNIKLGMHAHINLLTTIGHDCVIGDYFTTAPGANISGNCHFGDGVYLGSNAAIRQGINICNDVTIGMGGIVVKNITESGVYVGNPVHLMNAAGKSA